MREIVLGVGRGARGSGHVALVDDWRYEEVSQYAWHIHSNGRMLYASRANPHQYMHTLIMGVTGVDHADHNGLNNQEYNLRVADQSLNRQNARKMLQASSQYKGVSWHLTHGKYGGWDAYIKIDGRQRSLGRFKDETEAARAYDAAAREAFGAFACLNFPES